MDFQNLISSKYIDEFIIGEELHHGCVQITPYRNKEYIKKFQKGFLLGADNNFAESSGYIDPEQNIKLNKYVFTNGSKEHVKNITTHLGIDDQFDGVFDIVDAEYHPKPEAITFDLMVQKFKIDPNETLYIEDIAKNLSIGKERGTITAWLINDEYWGKKESEKDYIDYKIENLSLFLKEIRLLKNS